MTPQNIPSQQVLLAKSLGMIIVLFLASSCHSSQMDKSGRIEILFQGYTLLCTDDVPPDVPIRALCLTKCTNKYSDSHTLVPGRVYIFRKDTTLDNVELARTVIPKRLVDAGAVVTRSPKEDSDFIDLYIGAPPFSIEFTLSGHRGTIFNNFYASARDNVYWEELVVVFQ